MNLADCLWMRSSLSISVLVYGSQIIAPYSKTDLTRDMYAVLLQSCGQCLKFRLKNHNGELAFLLMLLIRVFHFKS